MKRLTTSRRAILVGLAAAATPIAPAVATSMGGLPASSATVDPIYAAIERRRAAYETAESRCAAFDESGTAEAEEEQLTAIDVLTTAENELRETEPTTIAGAVALLRYIADIVITGPPLDHVLDPAVLADALAKIEAGQS